VKKYFHIDRIVLKMINQIETSGIKLYIQDKKNLTLKYKKPNIPSTNVNLYIFC